MPRHPAAVRAVVVVCLTSLLVAGHASAGSAAPTMSRIAGADRYATSVAASRAASSSGGVPVVYLASGATYADALSAAPAAAQRGGGLLLTHPSKLLASTAAELKRLQPEEIVVVGGRAALGDGVLSAAKSYSPSVRRVGGADRYATSLLLAKGSFSGSATPNVVLATGRDFPDALSAAAAAAALHHPLLVVDGLKANLPAGVTALLGALNVRSALVVGGNGAVSAGISDELRTLLGPGSVSRASGKDRYATSVAVATFAFPSPSPGDAYVASGTNFPDALSVGVLAAKRNRPLYLALPYCVPAEVRTRLSATSVLRVVLVGGVGALRANVGRLVACQSIASASSPWVVVNKQRPLSPLRYTPSPLVAPSIANINGQSLRSDAAAALARLAAGSAASGHGKIAMLSGYRSYSYQSGLYSAKVGQAGRAEADRWVARPGYSEHQSGLGTDLAPVGAAACSAYTCFGNTPQGRWVAANAYQYGFVVRYEAGQTGVTGYNPEPWHLRYVGVDVARDYHDGGFHTLEAYFGLPPAPRY